MAGQFYRALVVDDEPMVRDAVTRAMSAHSFCCETAEDGRQGLQMFREQGHDLVVTDLRMPAKHGHALVLELLQEPNPPHIVVLTGVADHRLVKDLFSRGVDDVVDKPVDFNIFATKMLAIFERNRWSESLCRANASVVASSQQQLVAKTEAALELFALCIPPSLDQLLASEFETSTPPPAAVIALMQRLASQQASDNERRGSERFSLLSPVVALPVDKDFIPLGEAMPMTFCDLSEDGANLFHTRSVAAEYLALRWRSAISQKCFLKAVMHVTRCKPLGPCYEVAGQFVMHD